MPTAPAALDEFDQRVLGPCRPQHRQCVARLGPGLDRRLLCAGAGRRRGERASTSRSGAMRPRFALAADMALLTLGGALKRQEMLSARLGDILSELYLLSAVLKRWEDEGRQEADLPLLDGAWNRGFATIEARLDEIFANFPNRPAAWLLRFGAAARAAPARAVRSVDAGLRGDPARAVGDARPADRRHLPRQRRRRRWRASSAPSI